jgi:hypothetical protein
MADGCCAESRLCIASLCTFHKGNNRTMRKLHSGGRGKVHRAMKTYWRVEMKPCALLTSALDGGELHNVCPSSRIIREMKNEMGCTSSTHELYGSCVQNSSRWIWREMRTWRPWYICRTILKLILKEIRCDVWLRFMWLRLGSMLCLEDHGNGLWGSVKGG